MPPKGKKRAAKQEILVDQENVRVSLVNAQYDQQALESRIIDLRAQLDARCQEIMAEATQLATSIQTKLKMEICKLPKEVQAMPLQRFQQEFGEDVHAASKASIKANIMAGKAGRAATRGSMVRPPIPTSSQPMQTPMTSKVNPSALQTPMSTARAPRAGEVILSTNGSPLGEYMAPAATPLVRHAAAASTSAAAFEIQLGDGNVITLDESIQNVELPEEARQMVEKLQSLLSRVKIGSTTSSG